MHSSTKSREVDNPGVLDLYEQGLYLQAYRAACAIAPLPAWRGPANRVLAGRIAGNVGSPRLADALWFRAWRETPSDPEAMIYYARALLRRGGPLAAWTFMRENDLPGSATAAHRADWLAHGASILGHFRDFERAHDWMDRSLALSPDDAWLQVERAGLLQCEDRHADALVAARRALEMRPWYRPGVQMCAGMLVVCGEEDEAIELLQSARERIESYALLLQLAALQREREDHESARASVEVAAALAPLRDKDFAIGLAAMRSDAAYHGGDVQRAADFAEQASEIRFFEIIAERLAAAAASGDADASKRTVLPVGWVPQHHVTCAPATLSTISRYWSRPIDHLEIAGRICYDGTTNDSERQWAEDSGWVSVEFTVTLESARALIDRGIPFTLTTVEPGSAHLQAVIGYDLRRGSLLTRDPSSRCVGEMLGAEMLERYRASGPRGHAFVPAREAERFDGLTLPDRALFDLYHRLQRALGAHQRDEAVSIHRQMRAAAADHRLTAYAELSIARHDEDVERSLVPIDRLLAMYEDDPVLLLLKLGCLAELGQRDARLEIFQRMLEKKDCPPLFWQQYAQEIAADAREHRPALQYLRRALRRWADPGGTLCIMAGVLWVQRRLDEATELYRLAACTEDKREQYAKAYFDACRATGREVEAMAFLRERFDRFGDRSGGPARSLARALDVAGRIQDGLAVLEEAITRRPDDGSLCLEAAYAFASTGAPDRANELVAAAEGRVPRVEWLRTAAAVLTLERRHEEAIERWREVLELDPLCTEAHGALAQLLAETAGERAAIDHLEAASGRFPTHRPLQLLRLDRLRSVDPGAMVPVLREMVVIDPADAWAHRELAICLGQGGDEAGARAALAEACVLEPMSSSYWSVLGDLEEGAGAGEQARDALRRAVELDIDNDFAIAGLVRQAPDRARRLEDLEFVWSELRSRTGRGPGIFAFFACAAEALPLDELVQRGRTLCEMRPEAWETWSALINALLWADRAGEALPVADEATRRFPLSPRLFVDLARVHRSLHDGSAEIEALEAARAVSPDFGPVTYELAVAHRRAGDDDSARACLEDALRRTPLDPSLHAQLAELIVGEDRERAVQLVERAIELDPGVDAAWSMLAAWTHDDDPEAQRVVDLAQRILADRPGHYGVWLTLAQSLGQTAASDACLTAIDRAIALRPLAPEAYRLRAQVLARHGRAAEALAVCATRLRDDLVPPVLELEAARIEHDEGDTAAAITRVKALLVNEPEYAEGWHELAEWCRTLDREQEYLAAAERLCTLAPNMPSALAMYADAKLRMGDREIAKHGFIECLRRAPTFVYVGNALLRLHLEDSEWGAAEAVIAGCLEPAYPEGALVARIELACARRDPEAGLLAFSALARSEADSATMGQGLHPLEAIGAGSAVAAYLAEEVARPHVNPEVGYWWARYAALKDVSAWRDPLMQSVAARPGVGERALMAWLGVFADAPGSRGIPAFVEQFEARLASDDAPWAMTGAVLARAGRHGAARRWLSDWSARSPRGAYALHNLQLAFFTMGSTHELDAVLDVCRDLPPGDRLPVLDGWLAWYDALDGRIEEAAAKLARVAPYCDEDDALRVMHALTSVLIDAATGEGDWFGPCRKRLARVAREARWMSAAPDVRRAYRMTARAIADRRGSVLAKTWAWGRVLATRAA